MNSQTIISSLSLENVKPINLVLGNETYLMEDVKKAFTDLIPEEERTMNLGKYDMEEVPLAKALDDAMSVPFFGDKRLIFIQNPIFLTSDTKKSKIEHDINGFLDYLAHPEPTSILVILAPYKELDGRKKINKVLKKSSLMIDNQPLNEHATRQFIVQEMANKSFEIDKDALDLFLERTNAKLSTIMNELPKLFLYNFETHRITLSSVESLISKTLEQNIFDLVDVVIANNIEKSVTLYHDLILQNEAPIKINAILLGQFRLLLQVKVLQDKGYSQGDLASVLKVHPYRIKLALQKVKKFKRNDLRKIYLALVNLEKTMKTTQQDQEGLFSLFMLQINRVNA
ncbi:DNA polymerase III subunit delta [Dellaglioa sp. L3N]